MGTHAKDYVGHVKKLAGNITGMGIRYPGEGLIGTRVFDFELIQAGNPIRLYTLLDYTKHTLLVFGELKDKKSFEGRENLQIIEVKEYLGDELNGFEGKAILIRPDSYITKIVLIDNLKGELPC